MNSMLFFFTPNRSMMEGRKMFQSFFFISFSTTNFLVVWYEFNFCPLKNTMIFKDLLKALEDDVEHVNTLKNTMVFIIAFSPSIYFILILFMWNLLFHDRHAYDLCWCGGRTLDFTTSVHLILVFTCANWVNIGIFSLVWGFLIDSVQWWVMGL